MNTISLPIPASQLIDDEIISALRTNDVELVNEAASIDEGAMRSLGERCLRAHRWHDAARLFDRLSLHDAGTEMMRCLARNMASLERHRPEVYGILIALPRTDHCGIAPSATGRPTVLCRDGSGRKISLSTGNDPVASTTRLVTQLAPHLQAGEPLALCGIGDGYLLQHLAQNPPRLPLGMQQCVLLLDEDPHIVLQCLMIHDYSGAAGPIEQERFRWFLGRDLTARLTRWLLEQPFAPCPSVTVALAIDPSGMRLALDAARASLFERDRQLQSCIEQHYGAVTAEQIAALLGTDPARPPRVLLITTRFSTVLQYSTRDAAEGFRQLGFETRIHIEPAAWQRLMHVSMRVALADFKPDIVFQLDHLRREHENLFPPSLPFVCWIQDHLENLTNTTAGASVGVRDFVLSGVPGMYANRFGYPRRQLIQMPKLTRVPSRPTHWQPDGEDVVYVSSASHVPANRAAELIGMGQLAGAKHLIATCCQHMIETYRQGRSLSTPADVAALCEHVEKNLGAQFTPEENRRLFIDALFDKLNNPLYRQQSLGWAARIAQRHGLKFGLYGPGWEKHPDFRHYARGSVAYGSDLEALTRASRITLVLEPTLAVSYQRLLDALVAGGFCLIRHHPANLLLQQMLNFLCERTPDSQNTVAGVRAAIAVGDQSEFDRLVQECRAFAMSGDIVEHVRGMHRSRILLPRASAMPFLAEVSFAGEVEMEHHLLHYLGNADRRSAIARAQRNDVEARLTYAAGLRRVVEQIKTLVSAEAA